MTAPPDPGPPRARTPTPSRHAHEREVFLTELRVARGSERWCWVRWELFLFRDVRDVLPTADRDLVIVVHWGLAQPRRWLTTLELAGLHDPTA